MIADTPPIRAKKARYFEDKRLAERVLPPPRLASKPQPPKSDGWSQLAPQKPSGALLAELEKMEDAANGGLRREPELPGRQDKSAASGRAHGIDWIGHPGCTTRWRSRNKHQRFQYLKRHPSSRRQPIRS